LEYDKYTDQLYARKKSLHIDYIWEVLFGYSYAELRLAEEADERDTDKNLVYAGRAFKILNGWAILKFDSAEDNIYPLEEFFSWIDKDGIFEKIQSEVPEYEIPERANEFMGYVRDVQKYPLNVDSALKFIRRAEFWEIGIQVTKHFRHKKGLTYLQFLLSHPSKSYSCHELQQIELGHDGLANRHFDKDPEHTAPPPESIEENARIMKEEMAEMQRELEKAKEDHRPDVATIEKALSEQAQLYNSLYGNKGRPRDAGSQDEKARKAVAKTLKEAKDILLKELPELEPILKMVSSGLHLKYSPEDHPIDIFTGPFQK
jgi:hypothetical protein